MQLLPPQSIDPNVPAQIPADQLQDFKGFLDVVLDTVVGGAAPDVLTLGHQLWGGLAAIVVAWSGLKIAFSGTFEPWSLVRVVLGIAIPRTLLHYYSVPIPGVGFTFPAMVAAGGIWLQNLFISDVVSVGYTEMTALVQAFAARLGAAWSGGSLMTLMTEGVSVFFSSLVALMMGLPLVLGLVALFCLTYAQVIWAQVALAIVILLGPVFIPWLLFEPLAFLFWGWFRTLMVYTLYGVVAGAILRVFMGVGMGYVTTYTGALMGTGSSDPAELGLWVVVLLPLVVSGLMAGMKVGELAAMLVSGSGSVGSGIHGARGARRRTPQRCREPGPPPNPRRLKETSMNREHDAGREYAEIWGETVEANRKLRTLATILAGACLALAVLLLRVATVEPPRPIVVRVDEVGRAEAVAYEAATAQADPLDPTTKYFLNRFIADFYSRRQATVEQHWTRSLRFLSTELANAAFTRDGAEVAAMAAGTANTEHPGRAGRAPHPPRTGGAARRDRRLRPGPPQAGAGDPEGAVVDHGPVHVPHRHPLRARRLQPDGHPHHLPPGRPCPGHGAAQVIAHLRGREAALEPFGWTGRQAEWIALACLHSGVFIRAQWSRFLDAHPEQVRRGVHALIAQGRGHRRDRARHQGHRPRVQDLSAGASTGRSEPRTSAIAGHGVRRRAHAPPALARLRDRASRVCPGSRPSPRRSPRSRPSGSSASCCPRASTAAPPGTPGAASRSSCRSHWTRAVQCSSTSIPATTPRPRSVPGERRTAGSGSRSRDKAGPSRSSPSPALRGRWTGPWP